MEIEAEDYLLENDENETDRKLEKSDNESGKSKRHFIICGKGKVKKKNQFTFINDWYAYTNRIRMKLLLHNCGSKISKYV